MKKAFTLIELMVVITIIGIITGIVLPRISDITAAAKVAQVQGNLANLRTTIGMFHAKHGYYPVYSTAGTMKTDEAGDITSEGELSEDFTKFYSRSQMPVTPAGKVRTEESQIDSVDIVNRVLEGNRDNTGGWLYLEDRGEIYANLADGSYTGDSENEVWEEERIEDSDGSGEGKPVVPGGPGEWPDFIEQENVHIEGSNGYGTIFYQQGDSGSTITPSEWHKDWEKVYLYDALGNFMPNPDSDDGSYNHGDPIPVEDNNSNEYVAVLSKTDPETGETIYIYTPILNKI